jgi:cell division protein FtsX
MPNDREYVERTTVRETPEVVRSSAAGWWIAAIVAIIAVAGLLFVFSTQNRQSELQAARDQGAAEAGLAAATTDAQRAATQASQAAQSAVDSTTRASQRAAEAAQAAANQTRQSAQTAGDATRDASAVEPAPAPTADQPQQ